MKHYANLLDKLIKLCYGINGFSDTRIYAAVLLEQLDVVMDSITVYMEMYHQAEEEKEEILYLLEEYIRESVCAPCEKVFQRIHLFLTKQELQ